MEDSTMESNGHVVVHMPNGPLTVGNGTGGVQSAPIYVLRPDDEFHSSMADDCAPITHLASELAVVSGVGTGEALDADHLRSVVEKNSVSALKNGHHPFSHLTRRMRYGKNVGGSKVTHAEEPTAMKRSGNVKRQALLLAMRKDKKVVIVPILLLFTCMGLGLWGVFAASSQEREQRLANAQNRAADKAQTIASELRACYLPVKVMQSFVTRYPYFPTLNDTFDTLAEELLSLTAAGSIANMQLAPLGVLSAIQPLKGSEAAIGHDLLADYKNRDVALRTIASHNLTLAGPYKLIQGFMGAPARYPIYVRDVDANETFGMPRDATNCSICYDPATRTKFWGFATVLIHWDRFIHGVVKIEDLELQGLQYRITRVDDLDSTKYVYLGGSEEALRDPVEVFIPVPNNIWCLTVADMRGWTPNWEWPLVAMVVVMSLLLALLVGMALLGRAQQHLLLQEVLSANQQLEDAATVLLGEKERVEALMRRQYNLIECLGLDPEAPACSGVVTGGSGTANGVAVTAIGIANGVYAPNGPNSAPLMGERPSNPAEKIEEMRKKLLAGLRISTAGNGSSSGALGGPRSGGGRNGKSPGAQAEGFDLVLGEMIGEGTFGKVYRGLWRGSEVAVKAIILPTNMSGKEKREKMAVMEAAISSSLAHPNVVATYTYQIKPLKDSSSNQKEGKPSDDITASAIIVGNDKATDCGGSCMLEDPLAPFKEDLDEAKAQTGIHSYEVQLVLEFCDKGCLREALDAGIFFGQTGLNFGAILDTAADVAKALLHLHLNDVLHGDLKADNVMLKSCGRDGRGITAKVADFGLAIKMDHFKTHVSATFQGTLTHMAPEVLLHGQMSKAGDVFAFGITLWEMFTGGHPYQGVPGALLGHLISKEGKRPSFPLGTPAGFKDLAEQCWHRDAAQRPAFEEILATLTALRTQHPLPTPALSYTAMTLEQRHAQKVKEREAIAASLRAKLAEEKEYESISAPLPRLHHHYHGRKGSGSGAVPTGGPPQPPHRQAATSGDGAHPRSVNSPRCGSSRRSSRSRAKADEAVIMVGGRNVSLSNAITSKSVVLEPICETRYEGDQDAPAQEAH